MPLAPEITKQSGRPVLCFGSHSHFDHISGHHEFPKRLMHHTEANIIAEPNRDNVIIESWVRTDTFGTLSHEGFEPERCIVQVAPITQPVGDGDVIDLGDRVFEVLHLPGHSPGRCGVFEPATGLFFSGDIILDGNLLDDLHHSVPEDFVESMEGIRQLPVSKVHAGHHESFGRDRMCKIAEDYIRGRCRAGCPAKHRS